MELATNVKRFKEFFFPILSLVLAWEALSRMNVVSQFLFPPPSAVAKTLYELSMPPAYLMAKHILASTYRLLWGFVLAAGAGMSIGILMGMSSTIFKFLSPIISITYPIPSLAWTPIVILWLGLGDTTCLTIVFLSAIFPLVYNVSTGVRSVSKMHLWAAEIMGAGKKDIFFKVLMPGALPYILAGMKLGMGGGWRSLVAAEMLSATAYGLGYMIFEARSFLATDVMYSGIVALAVIGFLLEQVVFGRLEASTVKRWGMLRPV